jgi:hypothetical protein
MKGLELLKKYPKAGKVIKAWYLEKMLESFKEVNNKDDVPQDFIDSFKAINSIKDEEVAPMVDASPSALFHLFDINDIFIQINIGKGIFSYNINEGDVIAGGWNTRKEADFSAVEQAFEILDKKLEI